MVRVRVQGRKKGVVEKGSGRAHLGQGELADLVDAAGATCQGPHGRRWHRWLDLSNQRPASAVNQKKQNKTKSDHATERARALGGRSVHHEGRG